MHIVGKERGFRGQGRYVDLFMMIVWLTALGSPELLNFR